MAHNRTSTEAIIQTIEERHEPALHIILRQPNKKSSKKPENKRKGSKMDVDGNMEEGVLPPPLLTFPPQSGNEECEEERENLDNEHEGMQDSVLEPEKGKQQGDEDDQEEQDETHADLKNTIEEGHEPALHIILRKPNKNPGKKSEKKREESKKDFARNMEENEEAGENLDAEHEGMKDSALEMEIEKQKGGIDAQKEEDETIEDTTNKEENSSEAKDEDEKLEEIKNSVLDEIKKKLEGQVEEMRELVKSKVPSDPKELEKFQTVLPQIKKLIEEYFNYIGLLLEQVGKYLVKSWEMMRDGASPTKMQKFREKERKKMSKNFEKQAEDLRKDLMKDLESLNKTGDEKKKTRKFGKENK